MKTSREIDVKFPKQRVQRVLDAIRYFHCLRYYLCVTEKRALEMTYRQFPELKVVEKENDDGACD